MTTYNNNGVPRHVQEQRDKISAQHITADILTYLTPLSNSHLGRDLGELTVKEMRDLTDRLAKEKARMEYTEQMIDGLQAQIRLAVYGEPERRDY